MTSRRSPRRRPERGHREPERTCVGCRGKGPKRDLVRIVRDPSGTIGVDRGGRAPGRGAYVHPAESCARLAARRGALPRALRVSVDAAEAANLMRAVLEHGGSKETP